MFPSERFVSWFLFIAGWVAILVGVFYSFSFWEISPLLSILCLLGAITSAFVLIAISRILQMVFDIWLSGMD